MRNVSGKIVKKIKTQFYVQDFFSPENRALSMRKCAKNIVEPDGHQMSLRRNLRLQTHTQNNTYCHSTVTLVMHSRRNVTFIRTVSVLFLIQAIINSPRLQISDRQ
jgi:hypothetical protein